VNEEMQRFDSNVSKTPAPLQAARLLGELRDLLSRWSALRDGETLELIFST
jgi:hypothetical protein